MAPGGGAGSHASPLPGHGRAAMECKEEGCSRPVKSRDWCDSHYARWKRGQPVAGPILDRTRAGRICSEEGCGEPGTRSTRRRAFCESHYSADWRTRQAQCTEPGCEKTAATRGLCGMHYARTVRADADRPRCSIKGCGRAAVCRTYCHVHYQRWLLRGDPGEAALRKAANYQADDLCGVPGCQKPMRANRYCGSHNRRLSKFGITHTELERLLQSQRGRCAICRAGKPGGSGDWCIDHDHVTGQVRALLCNRCNLAIGLLQDDPEIIRAAARYVAKHRQMELFQRKEA